MGYLQVFNRTYKTRTKSTGPSFSIFQTIRQKQTCCFVVAMFQRLSNFNPFPNCHRNQMFRTFFKTKQNYELWTFLLHRDPFQMWIPGTDFQFFSYRQSINDVTVLRGRGFRYLWRQNYDLSTKNRNDGCR